MLRCRETTPASFEDQDPSCVTVLMPVTRPLTRVFVVKE